MLSLKVSSEKAIALIRTIPHSKCLNAINNQWVVKNGTVQASSVCWLFCWGKTGLNSPKAAQAARNVFDEIMNISFNDFDSKVGYEWAREKRYENGAYIEEEMKKFLNR